MQRKIVKLMRSSLPKYIRQKILLLDIQNNDRKSIGNRISNNRIQRPKSRRSNDSNHKTITKKKEKPIEKTFLAILRYLNRSIDLNLSHYPRVSTIWRALLPQVLKNEKQIKNIWLKSSNEMIMPRLSRGYAGRTNGWADTFDSLEATSAIISERKTDMKIPDSNYKKEIEQYNELAEQKFYTEQPPDKSKFSLKRGRETGEELLHELPPPQRCRLSCPLPPPEFSPPEAQEFLPHYQSASVRFASLQTEFTPKPKPMEGKPEQATMKPRTTNPTKVNKVYSATRPLLDHGDFKKDAVKRRKNYLNFTETKSQLYKPPQEFIPKMKALLFEPVSLKLNYDAVDAPTKIFKDEVLVQVTYSGVCTTDLFITEGKVSCGDNPVILGHEISGIVYATGSAVTHVKPGDNIAVNAYSACCVCRYCSQGLFSACLNEGLNNSIGISKNGGWAEFVVVKKTQVYKIPEELGLDQAALIQPLSCVLSAMSKLNVSHSTKIFIQGLGLSGCLWASVFHSRGHRNVFVSDKSDKKKFQFEALDLNYKFVRPEDIQSQSADVVIECTGLGNSIEKSFNILNPAGQMCFFGKPNPKTEVRCIPYEIIQKEITIVGNVGNASRFSEAVTVATSMGKRYLDFEKLGIAKFDLEDFREAFQLKKSGKVNKIIFEFDGRYF